MIVFGDSTSDTGRRFNAPASFVFDDIGPFPWTYLFEEPRGDVSELATINTMFYRFRKEQLLKRASAISAVVMVGGSHTL